LLASLNVTIIKGLLSLLPGLMPIERALFYHVALSPLV